MARVLLVFCVTFALVGVGVWRTKHANDESVLYMGCVTRDLPGLGTGRPFACESDPGLPPRTWAVGTALVAVVGASAAGWMLRTKQR